MTETEDADALTLLARRRRIRGGDRRHVTAIISLALYDTLGFAIALGWFAGISPAYFGWFRRAVVWMGR